MGISLNQRPDGTKSNSSAQTCVCLAVFEIDFNRTTLQRLGFCKYWTFVAKPQ